LSEALWIPPQTGLASLCSGSRNTSNTGLTFL
jgi:hypothetical protein